MILAAVAALATGAPALSLLRVRGSSGWGMLGFAFFLGAVLLAMWTHLLLLVSIPVNTPGLLVLPAVAAAVWVWKGDRGTFAVPWRPSIWAAPIAGAVAFWLAGAASWRELGFDPEVWYAIKWKSIATYGSIWNGDFTDPARQHVAVRRPLLLPCLVADVVVLEGREDHRWLRIWFALLGAGSLGVLHERVRAHPAWLAVFAWLPVHWRESGCFFAGWADPILGVFVLLALDALRKGERTMAAIALVAAVWLKRDAWTLPPILAAGTLLFEPRAIGRRWPALAAAAAAAVAWHLVSLRLPLQVEYPGGLFSAAPDSWPHVIARYGSELVRLKHWGFLWLLVPVAAVLRRWTREEGWWIFAIAAQLVVYVGVQATLPESEVRMWVRFQGMRLLSHLAPAAWAWIWLRAGPVLTRRAESL